MAYLPSINSAGGTVNKVYRKGKRSWIQKKLSNQLYWNAVFAFIESQKPGFVMTNPNVLICIFLAIKPNLPI